MPAKKTTTAKRKPVKVPKYESEIIECLCLAIEMSAATDSSRASHLATVRKLNK